MSFSEQEQNRIAQLTDVYLEKWKGGMVRKGLKITENRLNAMRDNLRVSAKIKVYHERERKKESKD